MATVIMKRGRDRRIRAGHPWVYAGEIVEVKGGFEPGDIMDVVNFQGAFLGRGFINPASQIRVRVLTWKDEPVDEGFFRRKIEAALDHRRLVASGATSFRVVFGEGDFLPSLIVDKYEGYLVVQTLALGMDVRKSMITSIFREVFSAQGTCGSSSNGILNSNTWGVSGIFERNDVPSRELEGLTQAKGLLWGRPPGLVEIHENGLRFLVDIEEGQKTGYFLDQRENRKALDGLCGGRRVLDAFTYTGGFAVHAASFGATEVIGIDTSSAAIGLARRNAVLNGVDGICSFREGNAFDMLRAFEAAGGRFDLIILDPPAFTKTSRAVEGAVRGYKEINLRAAKLLNEGGILVTCSCSHHMSEELFLATLEEALRDAGRKARILEFRGQARDHPVVLGVRETKYLKCAVLRLES